MYPQIHMRRSLAIFAVALFALAPLAALLPGVGEAQLPACCRRHGLHHCAMASMAGESATSSRPAFTAPSTCPRYHAAGPAATAAFAPVHPAQATPTLRAATLPAHSIAAPLLREQAPSGRAPPASV